MLHIDLETYSSIDIKMGVYAYVDAPDFEILLLAYNLDGFDRGIIDLASGERIPEWLIEAIESPHTLKSAANAQFERVCLGEHLGTTLDPTQWRCTLVKAAAYGLPGKLGPLAEVLGLDERKAATGKALIRYFCVPCKSTKANGMRTRNLPVHEPAKWQTFKEYCEQDVAVEYAAEEYFTHRGYDLSTEEWELYALDQRINDRGWKVDMDLVRAAIKINDEVCATNLLRMQELTGLEAPNSPLQLRNWLSTQMVYTEDLTKDTVSSLIDAHEGTVIADVLKLRQSLSMTSIAKYEAMRGALCNDGKVRGLLQFCGAGRTGRWAGRVVQVQNLPRTYIKDIDTARNTVLTRDTELMQTMYAEPQPILSQLIRTALVGDLVVADFSAIEARVLAWLAGEQWRLDVFNTHGKIYEASAAAMFNVPLESIGKGSPLRQKGKVAELALGYGGGVSAVTVMGALDMGLTEDELQPLTDAWRAANPAITKFWKDCNKAAIEALRSGREQVVGCCTFKTHGSDLHITLPSGRPVVYHSCKIEVGRFGTDCVSYMGLSDQHKWVRLQTYGGKLVENITQAVARDCLAVCLTRLDRRGYNIIAHIHDEVVCEGGDLEEMCAVMSQSISWAPGLPLCGEGYRSPYYKKD